MPYSAVAESDTLQGVDTAPFAGEMSPEEQEKVQKVLSLYKECAHAWQAERAAYAEYYRWWSGDHWFNSPKAEWQSKAAPNYIFSTIESVVPILTDGLPRWDATAKNAEAEKTADLADGVLNNVWDHNKMTQQLSRTVRGVQLYGTDYWWAYWDPDARDGQGEIIVNRIDPHNLLVDPASLDFDEANYVIYAENVSLGYIRRMWPDRGLKVKAGVMDKLLTRRREPVQAGGGYGDSAQDYISGGATYGADSSSRRDELVPGSEVDDFENYSVGKMATLIHFYYRKGEDVKCCVIAGGILLEEFDGQLPGVFPFAKTVNYPKDGAWHGASECEFIISPQQIINSMLAQIIDNAKLTGNPVLAYSQQSGFNPESYVAAPGVAIGVNGDPNSMIRWLEVPAIDPKLFSVIEAMRVAIDTISGVHDVTQGRRPAGITAASAIAELQEAAQVRIREKFRMVAAGLEDIGRIVWQLAMKYYDRPRMIRVSDQYGKNEFVTMNEQVTDSSTGQPKAVNTISDSDYDIRIDLGAGLPANKIQKANLALQMFQLKAIDLQALLDGVNYPHKEEILQRMMQQQQQQAQMQQQAMAQQGGGGMPQPPQAGGSSHMPAAMEELQGLIGKGLAPV